MPKVVGGTAVGRANQPQTRLCMEAYVTFWFFSCLNRAKSRFVFLNIILQSTYYSLHMTWANDHTRRYGANWWCDHHKVHKKLFFGEGYQHVVRVHTSLKVWWEINLDFLLLSVGNSRPPLQCFPVIQIEAKGKANPSQRRQDKAVSAELIHPGKKGSCGLFFDAVRVESKAGTTTSARTAVRSGMGIEPHGRAG